MFYFNPFLHNLSNLILIGFKGIEANHKKFFFTIHSDMKPGDTKRQVTTQTNKNDLET